MKLSTENIGAITVITLDMEILDAINTDEFKQNIFIIFDTNKHFVLNMEKIRFVDSSGCGTLLSCSNRLKKKGGNISLCSVQENVLNLFELIRLDRLIDIYKTKEAAIKALNHLIL